MIDRIAGIFRAGVRAEAWRGRRRPPSVRVLALHGIVILLCLLTVFPLLWMLSTAFKEPDEIFSSGLDLIPSRPTLQNFSDAFRLQPLAVWFVNSVVTSIGITAGKVLVSILAAYAFARYRFRGSNVLFALVVGTMVVPYVATIVPNYVLVSSLDWINTYQGVIVPSIAFTGFNIFLLRQAMRTLPQELFDAARIDGASSWTILWRVVLPLVRPAVAAVTIISFLWSWNLYLWPLLVANDEGARTLAVGTQFFAANSESGQQWGPMMAAATLATVPPLVLFVLAQKRIVSAFIESGVKR